jgi:hypothetical protein
MNAEEIARRLAGYRHNSARAAAMPPGPERDALLFACIEEWETLRDHLPTQSSPSEEDIRTAKDWMREWNDDD